MFRHIFLNLLDNVAGEHHLKGCRSVRPILLLYYDCVVATARDCLWLLAWVLSTSGAERMGYYNIY